MHPPAIDRADVQETPRWTPLTLGTLGRSRAFGEPQGSDSASHPSADPQAPDLDGRAPIHDMVVAFYRELAMDPLLGPVFEDVAEVDWSEHIPRLIDYWCRILLGDPSYQGAILHAHKRVHDIEPFTPAHFMRWYELFVETIDSGWAGPKAEQAKQHAVKIAGSLARHLGVAP